MDLGPPNHQNRYWDGLFWGPTSIMVVYVDQGTTMKCKAMLLLWFLLKARSPAWATVWLQSVLVEVNRDPPGEWPMTGP